MKAYAVFKEAIYRHECGGIFADYNDALNAAIELIDAEKDDYHRFNVVPFEMNKIYPCDSPKWCEPGHQYEPKALVELTREGEKVTIHVMEQATI